jgi:hypothetical protein
MKIIILLISIFLILSCADNEKNKLAEGSCIDNSDCNLERNEICNTDQKCELPHFELTDNFIIDNTTGLIWQNKYIQHKEREEAIKYCEDLVLFTYDDWRLEEIKVLGKFHKDTNENGIVPTQMFPSCLAEIATDDYVKTKKGAEQYGGNPGDQFNFSGPANVRCVRNK